MFHNDSSYQRLIPACLTPALIAIYYALSLGLGYGISNQNSYLIRPLRSYDSSLLANDWMTTEVVSHHSMFSLIAVPLYHANPDGWGFALANVLFVAFGAWIIYRILQTFESGLAAFLAFLLIVSLMRFTGTASLSGSYIFRGYLQPSTIGAIGMLAAILFLIRQRYAYSGLALAIGGLFHSNLLVLGIAVFFLTHVLLGRQHLARRLAVQLAAPMLAFAYFLPAMFEVAFESTAASEAREAFLLIRAPHHYDPATFKRQFVPFIGWLLIGGGSFWIYGTGEKPSPAHRATIAFVAAGLCMIVVATACTTIIYMPKVAQLQPWRLAPFVMLLCQMMFCLVVANKLRAEHAVDATSKLAVALVGIGCVVLLAKTRSHWVGNLTWLSPMLLITPVALMLIRSRADAGFPKSKRQHTLALAYCIAVLVCATGGYMARIPQSALICGRSHRPHEDEMFRWARTTTPRDAVFVTPPDMARFRLHAQRAIVVDWKTPPARGHELTQWLDRLQQVCGVSEVTNLPGLKSGYNGMSRARISDLVDTYSADFAVLSVDHCAPAIKSGFPVVFESDHFVVVSTAHDRISRLDSQPTAIKR
jgi:hypothetical protein